MIASLGALVLSLAAGGPATPDPAREFERGVEAYRRGAWSEAEELWRNALTAELPDEDRSRLHYALGNAAWRQGATLEAVVRYTAAVRLDPRSSDAWANLERMDLEEYLTRTATEGPTGPVPVLYANLLTVRHQD